MFVPITKEHQPITHTDNVSPYHRRTTNYEHMFVPITREHQS